MAHRERLCGSAPARPGHRRQGSSETLGERLGEQMHSRSPELARPGRGQRGEQLRRVDVARDSAESRPAGRAEQHLDSIERVARPSRSVASRGGCRARRRPRRGRAARFPPVVCRLLLAHLLLDQLVHAVPPKLVLACEQSVAQRLRALGGGGAKCALDCPG
eukprot:scaffold23434_cov135-Isochrysis_galbana.AAC.2